MQWVRFVDRRPPNDGPNEYVCAVRGGDPFVYHVFIDKDSLTDEPQFLWLEGLAVPRVPDLLKHTLRVPRRKIPPVPSREEPQHGEAKS